MKRFLMVSLAAVWLLAALAPLHAAQAPVQPPLSARLEALDWYAAAEPLNLRFVLRNDSAGSIWVLGWLMPSGDIDANILDISCAGTPAAYVGPLVKRADPTADDYIEIPAGGSYTVVFDPSAVYDMRRQGQYTVRYRVNRLYVRSSAPERAPAASDEMRPLREAEAARPERRVDSLPAATIELAPTEAVSLWFEGVAETQGPPPDTTQVIGGYSKCTTAQQTTLKTAHANAITLSGLALSYVTANTASTSAYTYWFGTFSTANNNTVKSHYNLINDAFVNKSVVYDCGCKKSYYAYVYPTQPYKIYLCKVFWTAPALGRDSKAGTLVHEMSHFNVTAATDDYVYGATGAHNLALSNPSQAIDNADNHEYFAEDKKMQ